MQVILKKDIPQVGKIGQVVQVKNGYARNFLIPRDFALPATTGNARSLEHQRRLVEAHRQKVAKGSEEVAESLKKVNLSFKKRLNESGKLFGSLSSTEVSEELAKKGFEVDRRDIQTDGVKTPGTHQVKVRLPGDLYVEIPVNIEGIEESKKEKAASTKKAPKKSAKAAAEGAEKTEAVVADESAAPSEIPEDNT